MKIKVTDTVAAINCEIIENTDMLESVVLEITDNNETFFFCARVSDPYCGDRAKRILSDFNAGQLQEQRKEIVGTKMCELHELEVLI